MNNEQLQKRIAAILDVSEDKSQYVFSIFKKMLSDYLTIGEALTIDNLGTFQLKEQLSHSSETKLLDPSEKALTLIFSAESDGAGDDFLFINIELENMNEDHTEFDESIFELGIRKPLATDSINETEVQAIVDNDDLENRILKLFESSNKSRDFDLWEDHLKTKEQKSILESEDVLELEDFEEGNLQENEEEFSLLDDEDVFNEFVEENDTITEELSEKLIDELESEDNDTIAVELSEKLIDEFEPEDNDSDEKFEFESEDDSKKTSEPVEEISEVENISPDENDGVEKDDSDTIEKTEEFPEEEELPIQEKMEAKEENVEELKLEEKLDDHEESIEEIDVIEKDEKVLEDENSDIPEKIEDISEEKSNKLIISVLIAIFVIIAGISIYYIFLNDSMNSIEKYDATIEKNEKNMVEQADIDATLKEENISGEDILKEQESVPVKPAEEISTLQSSDIEKQKPKESEVSQNIFFDGSNFSIQVSSWKQRVIAEREEQKLIKRGYPTFIQQVYIQKFDGVWNRVRVGPFATLEEAKEVQAKLIK